MPMSKELEYDVWELTRLLTSAITKHGLSRILDIIKDQYPILDQQLWAYYMSKNKDANSS